MRVHMHMRLYLSIYLSISICTQPAALRLQARARIITSGVPDCIVSWFELALGGGK